MWLDLKGFNVPENELPEPAKACLVLPDYKNNPRIVTPDEVMQLLKQSYKR